MTSFGLYYRPDCTMWAVQKSTNARLPTDMQPDPYTVPTCAARISATSKEAEPTRRGMAKQSTR